jgi:xylulokinase
VSELLLGIDIGTQSAKGVLARPDGTTVRVAERSHRLSLPRPGWAEHDAEETWWRQFRALCTELARPPGERLAGVCVSGIGPCLLAADGAGRALRPAILYGIDTRATREIDELNERYGADQILARCGSPLSSQAVGPKLAWLRRNEPEVWTRTRQLLMASSFCVERLTGEYVLDHHSASQCDPLYDIERATWIGEWAEDIAPGLALPRLLWPGEIAGEVTAQAGEETGIAPGTPVVAGTIDAWSESLAAGARSPGDVMIMYGSTTFLIEVVDRPVRHPALWGTAGVFPGSQSLAGGLATSGLMMTWLRKLSGYDFDALASEAAATPPGAEGLLVLPYFAGERTPIFDPDARGLMIGLTLQHGRGHIARALLEANALGVRHNLEAMSDAGAPPRRLVAVGGGTRAAVGTRAVSDATGLRQDLCRETVGASYGDAYLAALGVALARPDDDWSAIAATIEPDAEAQPVYDELYAIYRELYPATRDQAHALARLQRGGARDAAAAGAVALAPAAAAPEGAASSTSTGGARGIGPAAPGSGPTPWQKEEEI